MTVPSDHAEIEDLLASYALDAVEAEEAERIDHHLSECPRCRAQLDSFRAVAAALGNSVVPVPESLWDRVAARLGEGPQRGDRPTLPSLASILGRPVREGALFVNAREVAPPRIRSTVHHRHPSRRAVWPATIAALALVIALLGVRLAQTNSQLDQTRQALQARGSAASVQAALNTPGHQLVHVVSPSGHSLADVVYLPSGQGYLTDASMSALPSDETYQLWAMIDGQPISVGLLGSHPRQAAFTLASRRRPSQFAVTVEPAGGAAMPDRTPVASGAVTT